ncbi:MAG: metal ABC transporter substrate-binding protein [Mollicutes bacterium]|nr:metal ABC transporter substrate-binding protein [Mollicutes bacterium]
MKKKKNLLKIFCLLLGLFSLTGCFKRDDMEDISIVVSTYPIEYIVKSLYGAYSNIDSIYPSGVDVNNYELTDKQISDYSKNTLFVYNGLSDEKNIARSFLNQNRNMKIIDVSYGLNIEYGKTSEELWLSPNNYLMLATTTKNNLSDFINSKYLIQMIDTNYKKLQEDLSLMDANLRSIGAASKKPVITTTNSLKYLENYDFTVISLEDSKNVTTDLKNNFKNGTYTTLFIKKGETSDTITDLVDNYKAKKVEVNMMNTLDSNERNNSDDYLSIMNEYLRNLREATTSE